MRELFISLFEKLITVIVVLMCIGVLIAAVVIMFSEDGGFLMGIGVLIAGGIYAIMTGGLLYLGLGIYNNTKRTAEATEALAAK